MQEDKQITFLKNITAALLKDKIRTANGFIEFLVYSLVFIIPFSKAGIEIFGISAIVVWVVLKGLRIKYKELSLPKERFLWIKEPIFIAVILFFFMNFLSCLNSVSVAHSLEALFTKTLEYLLFFFIIIDIFKEHAQKKLKILGWVIFISLAILCVDALIQYFTIYDVIRKYHIVDSLRVRACFLSPNDFGNYIVLFMPVLFALFIQKNICLNRRILTALLFLASFICIILSYSRAAWLGLLTGMLFFCFARSKKLTAVFLVILISVFFLSSPNVKNKLTQIDSLEKLSTSYRIVVWQEALSIIKDYPIFGTGLNTYTQVGPKYKIHQIGGMYPHNSYLHMAAETGILGLAAFLWFLWVIFRRGWRLLRHLHRVAMTDNNDYNLILGLMAGLFGFLINAFFDTTLYAIKLVSVFWIACGILIVVYNVTEQKLIESTLDKRN